VLAKNPIVVIVFLVAWTLAWPLVGKLHPYWLGLFRERSIGLAIALGIVASSHWHESVLRATERFAASAWLVLRRALAPTVAVLVASVLLFLGFHTHLDSGPSTLRIGTDANITAGHALRHFGLFVLLTILWVGASLTRASGESAERWRRRLVVLVAAESALILALAVTGRWESAGGLALYLTMIPAVVAALVSRRDDAEQVFSGLLLLGGWALAAVSETIVVIDRMNTVFKLYHPAWMLLAIGSAGALAGVWQRLRRLRRTGPVGRLATALIGLAVAGAMFVTLACAWRGVHGVVTRDLKASAVPTIDGLDFLRHTPEERALLEAVEWLNRNVTGVEVVAEAFTDRGYDESARVAKYTGLPIVLGWPHHVKQRGRSHDEVVRRGRDLEMLYRSESDDEILSICRRYDIRYIFVGELETTQYDGPVRRLSRARGLREVFRGSSGRYVIFEVDRAARGAT
jgi:uncharacterized membrane protein